MIWYPKPLFRWWRNGIPHLFKLPIQVFPYTFAESSEEGFPDVFELSVFEVEEEFLDGAADFDPWMAPGIDSVKSLFVIHIFYHIFRVTERELRLMAPHGEDAPITFRGGLDASSEMSAVGREP